MRKGEEEKKRRREEEKKRRREEKKRRREENKTISLWLHPSLRSVAMWQCGHCLEVARMNLMDSVSDEFFSRHSVSCSHDTGLCASAQQLKQYFCPHKHSTTSAGRPSPLNLTTLVQVGLGQKPRLLVDSTNCLR
jgi:hypothetical protein